MMTTRRHSAQAADHLAPHRQASQPYLFLAIDADAISVPSMSINRTILSTLRFGLILVSFATAWSANAELVADGFQDPVAVVQPPGITDKLFVIEQVTGKIRIISLPGNSILAEPFLTVPVFTLGSGSECGLLGIAFHPQFANNGLFFVNRTMSSAGQMRTEICRFQAVAVNGGYASAISADPTTVSVILTFDQPEDSHNGGWIDFDAEENLCIATGDGGGADDMHGAIGNAQERTNLLGKILRIRPNLGPAGSSPTYTIPPTNPFAGQGTFRPEIWHYGLRNPWRCSFDRSTGDLWIGDVGQFSREEIDFAQAGQSGLNYGWRPREGMIQNPAYPSESPVATATNPLMDFTRSQATAIIGGYVCRDPLLPNLAGIYLCADAFTGNIYGFSRNQATGAVGPLLDLTSQINENRVMQYVYSFGEGQAGDLYLAGIASSTGRGSVWKLAANPPSAMLSAQDGPLNNDTFTVDILFSKPVTDLTVNDFVVNNAVVYRLTGDGTNYTLVLEPIADGPMTVDLPADSAFDLHGTGNAAAVQLVRNVLGATPTVLLQAPAGPLTNSPFPVTVTFSEPVTRLTASDFVLNNAVVYSFTNNGTNNTLILKPIADGRLTVDLPADSAFDLHGTGNAAAVQLVRNVDSTAPTVVLTAASGPFNTPFAVKITFSEPVSGFSASDLIVTNGSAGTVLGGPSVFTCLVTPIADGAVLVDLMANAATDLAGNGSQAALSLSRTFDSIAPTAVIAADSGPFNAPFAVTITFSEPVSGFSASGIIVTNGSAGTVSGGPSVFTCLITPIADGTVLVDLMANAATDLAGNRNVPAIQLVRTYKAASVESSDTKCALGSGLAMVVGFLLMLRVRSSIHRKS